MMKYSDHRTQRHANRSKYRWLQQNHEEIDELYGTIKQFHESRPGTLLQNLTYDKFMDFVLSSSQCYVNPYLPIPQQVREEHLHQQEDDSDGANCSPIVDCTKPSLVGARHGKDD